MMPLAKSQCERFLTRYGVACYCREFSALLWAMSIILSAAVTAQAEKLPFKSYMTSDGSCPNSVLPGH
jgi:hypothetical protein